MQDNTLDFDPENADLARRASLSPESASKPTIPGYLLEARLGEGTFGEVWSGVQTSTQQKVAVKTLHGNDRAALTYLKREVSRLAQLSEHPHILSLIDANFETQPAFLVTPRLKSSLADYARNEVTIPQVCQWMEEVASALKFIHERGILHCDLKPANILLDLENRIRVVDFGQAHLLDELGISLGTLWFMPPEQVPRASQKPSPEVTWDLYAWGATAYILLTGRAPRQSDEADQEIDQTVGSQNQLDVYRRILKSKVLRPLRDLSPKVDRDFAAIVERTLSLNAEDRYSSATDLLADLRRRRRRLPIRARPNTLSYRARRLLQRNWLLSLILFLTSVLLLGTLWRARLDHVQLLQIGTDRLLEKGLVLQKFGSLRAPLLMAQAVIENPNSHKARLQAGSYLPYWVQGQNQFTPGATQGFCLEDQEYVAVDPKNPKQVLVRRQSSDQETRALRFPFAMTRLLLSESRTGLIAIGQGGQLSTCPMKGSNKSEFVQLRPTEEAEITSVSLVKDASAYLVGLVNGKLYYRQSGDSAKAWSFPAAVTHTILAEENGRALACAGPLAKLIDLKSGKVIAQWPLGQRPVETAWCQPGKSVWIAEEGGSVRLWSEKGNTLSLVHGSVIKGMKRLANGDLLTWGGNSCRHWDGQGRLLGEIVQDAAIELVDADQQGQFVLSCTVDARLQLWNQRSHQAIGLPLSRQVLPTHISLIPGRKEFFVVAGVLEVWSFEETKSPPTSLNQNTGADLVQSVVWSHQGGSLAVARRGDIEFWNSDGFPAAKVVRASQSHRAQYAKLARGPEGTLLALLLAEKGWTAASLEFPKEKPANLSDVRSIAQRPLSGPTWVSKNGEWACSYHAERDRLEIWATESLLADSPEPPSALWVVPCQRRVPEVVCLLDDGTQLAGAFQAPKSREKEVRWFRQTGEDSTAVMAHSVERLLNLSLTSRGLVEACATSCQLFGPQGRVWTHKYSGQVFDEKSSIHDNPEWRQASCDEKGNTVLCLASCQAQWIDAASGRLLASFREGRNGSSAVNQDGSMICTMNGHQVLLRDRTGELGSVPFSDGMTSLEGFFAPNGQAVCLTHPHSVSIHPLSLQTETSAKDYLLQAQIRTQRFLEGDTLLRFNNAHLSLLQGRQQAPRKRVLR